MDTLTHALLGALAVRAALPGAPPRGPVPRGTAMLVGGLAAAFPDLDYLSFWIDPLAFLADWHRGPTHSLLMAPLWALLLGIGFARLFRRAGDWLSFVGFCLLALLSHIASDLITAYGTLILWPLSDLRVAIGTTFVVDPFFSALVIIGLTACLRLSRPAISARLTLLALAVYLGFQLTLKHQARSLGEDYVQQYDLTPSSVHALPQPLSPLNWLIIVSEGERHHVALANLTFMQEGLRLAERLGWLGRLWAAYRPPQALAWITHHLHGSQPQHQDLAEQAWRQHAFDGFRRFAKFPALYRIDRFDAETCVWFTDLRYVLPGLTPPFRYGMCRSDADLDWELYRLRRFTHDTRHFLGDGWTRR